MTRSILTIQPSPDDALKVAGARIVLKTRPVTGHGVIEHERRDGALSVRLDTGEKVQARAYDLLLEASA